MTFIVLFISHIEPVVYSPILPAREPGPSVLEPTTEFGRGRHAFGRSAWRVDSPGGSLRAGRPTAVCSLVHSGGQRRLHRQAAQESDPSSAPKSPCPGSADQRLGNGGSSSTASHIVNDLQKCIDLEAGRPLKTICLTDCTPLIMAWANDTDYTNVFA